MNATPTNTRYPSWMQRYLNLHPSERDIYNSCPTCGASMSEFCVVTGVVVTCRLTTGFHVSRMEECERSDDLTWELRSPLWSFDIELPTISSRVNPGGLGAHSHSTESPHPWDGSMIVNIKVGNPNLVAMQFKVGK